MDEKKFLWIKKVVIDRDPPPLFAFEKWTCRHRLHLYVGYACPRLKREYPSPTPYANKRGYVKTNDKKHPVNRWYLVIPNWNTNKITGVGGHEGLLRDWSRGTVLDRTNCNDQFSVQNRFKDDRIRKRRPRRLSDIIGFFIDLLRTCH